VSTVADRYAYLGMFAVALVIADGLSRLPAGKTRRAVYGAAVCALVFWAVVTTFQLRNWRNGITLFSHAVEVNPRSSFGFQCLAQAYVTADNPQAALIAASRSIELNPANEQYHAMVLAHPGAPVVPSAESASDWAQAAQAHITLANALDRLNRLNQAAEELTTAVSMNPGNVIAITDLAFVLGRSGHETQAQAMLHRALQIDPSFLPARNALRRVQPQSAK
jgi:tetratricopeptide (TPR) repeat protein